MRKPIIVDGVRIPTLTEIRRHIVRHAWNGRDFESKETNEEVFSGQCEYASTALSEILTGTGFGKKPVDWHLRVRGFYCGDLSYIKRAYGCDPRAFTDGKHMHSWVEFGGVIIDPTWWQFAGDPVRVYVFKLNDKRFIRDESA